MLLYKLLLRNVIRSLGNYRHVVAQIAPLDYNLKLFHHNWPIQYQVVRREFGEQIQRRSSTKIIQYDDNETDSKFSLKLLLYPNENNLITLLNQCRTQKELLEFVKTNDHCFRKEHCVQSVIILWTLFTEEYGNKIFNSELVDRILNNIQPHVKELNLNELSCCYLYLRKMDVPSTNPVLEEMLLNALNMVNTASEVPLAPLSRLLIGINFGKEFHTPTVCQHFMPHILRGIENCETAEDVRLLAICLANLHQMVCNDTLESFNNKVRKLHKEGIISAETPKTIVKVLRLLNIPKWSRYNATLIRDLMYTLEPGIDQLNEYEFKFICYLYEQYQEPAGSYSTLKNVSEALMTKSPSPSILESFIIFAEPKRRENLISIFKEQLQKDDLWDTPNAVDSFFKILRALKISDLQTCDMYWNRVIERIEENPMETIPTRFLRHCNRYMNFNNNLGGTYRNKLLEKKLSNLSMSAIENDLAGRIPSQFTRLASFVLAYGHTPFQWKKFPNIILSKVINMHEQFTPVDCLYLSRGLQIALEMRFRHSIPSIMNMQIATIDSILTGCAERYLSNEDALMVNDLNLIIRTLGIRKSLKNSVVYRKALEKYKELDYSRLNSRIIRDIIYNLNISYFLDKQLLENMLAYIETNHDHVTAETVEKVLSCTYNLGYTPAKLEVLDYAAQILLRDFNHLSGLSLVQACLALCFYKTIPEELINRVFSAKFIQRVEEEIQMCYSKATYPERVLNLIMQLNRTVCLDFPEAKVPWFQQNYIEAQLSKKPALKTRFSEEIKRLLTDLLGSENYYRCNHTTPYGYQIDFVIHFDRDKKPIIAPIETTMLDRITKVAILLLKLDSFCENDLTTLRGPTSLKIKHLEMMGYKVLHINEHEWYTKYMNKPGAKANYLQCLLQISN